MSAASSRKPAPNAVTADEVLAAHFTLANVPGAIEAIVLDGASGWTSPNPHPVLSLMRWTTPDPAQAAADLDTVLERFRPERRGFDWMTGPRCAEAGLTELMAERGFVPPALQVAAMVKELGPECLDAEEAVDGYRICRAPDDDRQAWQLMASGFDVPEEVGEAYHRAYVTASPHQRTDVYKAETTSTADIAAVGYLSWIADGANVLLRVSATAEQHGGKGLYRALVLARLAEAARRGARRAFVHAYSEWSQRALAQLGFSEVGRLQLHRWRA